MKKITAIVSSGAALLASAAPVFAAVDPKPVHPSYTPTTTVHICPLQGSGFEGLCSLAFGGGTVQAIITIAFMVAAIIALAFLIWGGIRWILSGGEKEKVEEARGTIVAALVGLVIVFLAYFILAFVFKFIGITFFQDFNIPSLTGK